MGIRHSYSTSHHANTNGAVERFNRTLKMGLRAISLDIDVDFSQDHTEWDDFVPTIASCHNNRPSRRTHYKYTPTEVFLGYRPDFGMDIKVRDLKKLEKKARGKRYIEWIRNQARIIQTCAAKEQIEYHRRRKVIYDKGRKLRDKLKAGDIVKHWKGKYPPDGRDKLKIHWTGPWRVVSTFNDGATVFVHPVHDVNKTKIFSVDRLRKTTLPMSH